MIIFIVDNRSKIKNSSYSKYRTFFIIKRVISIHTLKVILILRTLDLILLIS
jgi:hypothetical protein